MTALPPPVHATATSKQEGRLPHPFRKTLAQPAGMPRSDMLAAPQRCQVVLALLGLLAGHAVRATAAVGGTCPFDASDLAPRTPILKGYFCPACGSTPDPQATLKALPARCCNARRIRGLFRHSPANEREPECTCSLLTPSQPPGLSSPAYSSATRPLSSRSLAGIKTERSKTPSTAPTQATLRVAHRSS